MSPLRTNLSSRQVAACLMLTLASLIAPGAGGWAQELSDAQVVEALTTEGPADVAIRHGLDFINAHQAPDGSFAPGPAVAVSGLAVMANLCAGQLPDRKTVGGGLRHAVDFLLSCQDLYGYFGSHDSSRMYGHGIATLALAESLGTCRDEELEARLRAALTRAVAVTVGAARIPKPMPFTGGWRYNPDDPSADLSLSGWQLMSLHAAQQGGIAVPAEVVTGAVDFARRLTTADGKVGYDHVGDDHAPLRGLSMLCFAIGSRQADAQVACIAERIRGDPITWQGPYVFYRAYYDAVGMSRAAPETWDSYGLVLDKVLTDHQNADGSWPNPPGDDEGQQGAIYMTAMAVLALGVHRHLLPVYQR